ncbi:MAG TPA: hypothetical protein VFV86_12520, partial [Nitrososphaeraceae archaeon]|nr:hypothetical protein [Nitrososphaeraceae archaeon]
LIKLLRMFLHPSYEIKVGSSIIKSELSDTLISLLVDLTMTSYAGYVEIVLRIKEDNKIEFKKNSPITVSIGYDKNPVPIFSGKINSLSIDLSQISIIALNSIYSLFNFRIDRFYENQTAGDIVKDLAKEAGVKVDDVANGFKFPYYAIDSNKNAFEHIKELAILCGFDVYCTNEDKLVFKTYESTTKHKIMYGQNIINLKKLDPITVYNSLSILGDSPSSSKGTDTSHWLTKKQIKGFAESDFKKDDGDGETGKALFLTRRFVKDEDTAVKIAAESLKKLNSKMLLQIEIVGNQEISLGDSIIIEKLPLKELNGEYRINSIEHFISKYTGYVTTLKCQGA